MSTPDSHPTVLGTLRTMSRPVQVLLWGQFISNLTAFLNAFLVLFLVGKGMSAWWAGIALAGLLAGRIAGTAIGGAVADRLGYRWTTVVSMLGSSACVAAMVQVRQPWMAISLAFVTGVVSQAYRPASQAWIMELTPPESLVMLFSIYRLAFNVGSTVGPLLGALLIESSFSLLFYADAAASLAFGILAMLALPNDRPARKAERTTGDAVTSSGYRRVFADGRFMLVVFGLFLTAVGYIQLTAALPLFITGTGHPARIYALMLALNGFMVIVFEVGLTKYTQRMRIQLPIVIGMALLGIGHYLYLAPLGIGGLAIATFTWTLGEIVAAPSMLAYPGRVAPPDLRTRYIAAASIPTQIGYAIGPLVGVAAWKLYGSGVWLITGSFGLLAAAVTLLGAKSVPAASEEETSGVASDGVGTPGGVGDVGEPGEIGQTVGRT